MQLYGNLLIRAGQKLIQTTQIDQPKVGFQVQFGLGWKIKFEVESDQIGSRVIN